MTAKLVRRVLPMDPLTTLQRYVDHGGGRGLAVARGLGPEAVIAAIERSGLTARGGAGAPCGPKWRTARAYATGAAVPPSVVVNAAEGEPGSFKDRAILSRNPYQVIEGALIAASAIGASDVILALKRTHGDLRSRLAEALEECRVAGWLDGVEIQLFEGPSEYLYGEETAMLEAIDGRPPFPRIAPPYRRGVHEVVDPLGAADSGGATPAHIQMAGPSLEAFGSPTLVNNVETLANVPNIVVEGPDWFRSMGTAESPGTLVCTVTGATRSHGVGEVPMGTPLRDVIDLIGGGPKVGRSIKAVMGGAATPVMTADQLDTPVSNEGMRDVGGMLGCGGFIVFDDHSDMAAVAAGVAHFLSIESCGLCTACKEDGLGLAHLFARVRDSQATDSDLAAIHARLETVTEGARCAMASQFPLVLRSILVKFADEIDGHIRGTIGAAEPELIASIVNIDGTWAYLDETHRHKQPDWSFDARWSGKSPADRLSTVAPR